MKLLHFTKYTSQADKIQQRKNNTKNQSASTAMEEEKSKSQDQSIGNPQSSETWKSVDNTQISNANNFEEALVSQGNVLTNLQ